MFGYKSRPPTIPGGSHEAVDACNVFFHLTYTDAVDLNRMKVEDPKLYHTYVKQIENFGQAPSLLFSAPHPTRLSLSTARSNQATIWPIASQPQPR